MEKHYKIMEYHDGRLRTLFHANDGSKVLPTNKWLHNSNLSKLVSDGSGKTKYEAGFHIFKELEEAKKYLYKMFRKLRNKVIVECFVLSVRQKHHAKGEVYLCDTIYLSHVVHAHVDGYDFARFRV